MTVVHPIPGTIQGGTRTSLEVNGELDGTISQFSLPWQMRGECRNYDTEVFFTPDGERGRSKLMREYRAIQICQRCPVLATCREFALTTPEPHGIWGGMTEAERHDELKRRARLKTPGSF